MALSAQTTQAEADSIVIDHLANQPSGFTIYAKEDVQTNFVVLTATNEKLKLNYPCWVYYVNFTDETNSKYLIVKESNGNVLEVNAWNKDYTVWFNGTAAACPHVAGVAALILSVNSNLTGQQIRDIIESTTRKVGLYFYNTVPNRPNGKWHEEMGYGLVNSYAAVLAAQCYNLPTVQGTITQNTTWNTPMLAIDTVTISNGATLTITSEVKCERNTTIIIQPGGKLNLNGGTLTNGCIGGLWQGITVLGDPMLPSQDQGYNECNKNFCNYQ